MSKHFQTSHLQAPSALYSKERGAAIPEYLVIAALFAIVLFGTLPGLGINIRETLRGAAPSQDCPIHGPSCETSGPDFH